MRQPTGTQNAAKKMTKSDGNFLPEKVRLGADEQRGYWPTKRIHRHARILCWIGIHSGEWAYVTSGACARYRLCAACGHTQTRTKHQLEWQYVNDGACEQTKICTRCAGISRGLRTRHEWDYNDYAAERRQCARCRKAEIRGTTREKLCEGLSALGLSARLAPRGRPEEKCATDSMGLIEIDRSPIRWVNVRKWDNEGPVYATEYGIPDSSNLPKLQIRSVLVKNFPVFGRVIDVQWKGDDQEAAVAERLRADQSVRAAVMASGCNITVRTSPECGCWLIPNGTKDAPSALLWDCYEKIATSLLAYSMKQVQR